jgi:hypothetical protein
MQLNVHKVSEITVQNVILAKPGEDKTWPDGLVCTHVNLVSNEGPIKIVCFGVENAKPILVTTLRGA